MSCPRRSCHPSGWRAACEMIRPVQRESDQQAGACGGIVFIPKRATRRASWMRCVTGSASLDSEVAWLPSASPGPPVARCSICSLISRASASHAAKNIPSRAPRVSARFRSTLLMKRGRSASGLSRARRARGRQQSPKSAFPGEGFDGVPGAGDIPPRAGKGDGARRDVAAIRLRVVQEAFQLVAATRLHAIERTA